MKFLLKFYVFVLNIIYFFLKLMPTKKNKILFLSRQTDKASIDFRMLISEIQKNHPEYSIIVITKRIEKKLTDVAIKEIPVIFYQMYHLATSNICVIDGYNIPISVLRHKKNLKVIQIWHSLGAIKKFGYQSLTTDKDKLIAECLCMHKNYDYIISGSNSMIPYFKEAFGYSDETFLSIGLPRVDYLLTKGNFNRNKIYSKHPELKNKKIILYAPTFRNNKNYKIDELINSIDLEKYFLIVKLHPNIKYSINPKNVYLCESFTTLQLLSVADYVITDYSAISIEASILNIPIYLYVYDYDEYKKNPGININLYDEFPGYVFQDPSELYKRLSKDEYDFGVVKKYKKKYTTYLDKKVTKRLADFIVNIKKSTDYEENL